MAIIFKYKLQKRGDGVEMKLPHIPIEIKGNGSIWIQTMALVDSGADVSVIPQDLAELINLDLSGEESVANGIGGEIKTIKTKMKIKVHNSHESYEFESIPVEVIMQKTKAPMILGRNGFFDKFIIVFDHQGERIKLQRKIKN